MGHFQIVGAFHIFALQYLLNLLSMLLSGHFHIMAEVCVFVYLFILFLNCIFDTSAVCSGWRAGVMGDISRWWEAAGSYTRAHYYQTLESPPYPPTPASSHTNMCNPQKVPNPPVRILMVWQNYSWQNIVDKHIVWENNSWKNKSWQNNSWQNNSWQIKTLKKQNIPKNENLHCCQNITVMWKSVT